MNKIFLVIAIFISQLSYGASYQGKVTNIFAYNEKIYVFIRNGTFDNSDGNCSTRTDGIPAYIDINTEYGKSLLSLLLVAKSADKLVWASITSSSCVTGPYGSSGELKHMDLKG